MIEFDYEIKRDEGSNNRTFIPDKIKGPISNISWISAPNSAGKSTLMNLIALSLFGTDQNAKSVNESLRDQIYALTNFDIQKLTFWIRLTDDSGKNGFIVKKDDFETNDIVRKEIVDGIENHIDSDRFHKKFNLIYDIPDNPLERLKELTKSVKLQQTNWKTELTRLRFFVQNNIKELLRRKDDYDVEEINKRISKAKEDQAFNNSNKTQFEQKLSRLQKYYYLRKYKEIKSEYDSVKEASKEANKEKRKTTNELGEQAKGFRERLEERGIIMERIKDLKGTIIQNVSGAEITNFTGFSKWEKKARQAPTSESVKEDLQIVNQLENKCDGILTEFQENSTLGEVEFYDKLVTWIRENMSSNYQIPGTEMTFSVLVEKLMGIVESNRESFKQKKQFKNIKDWIEELKEEIRKYEDITKFIGKQYTEISSAQRDSKYEEISDSSKELNEKRRELKDKLQSLLFELSKFNVEDPEDVQEAYNVLLLRFPELNDFGSISLQKIEMNIKDLKLDIKNSSDKEQRDRLRLETLQGQLKIAEKIEPHKYQNKAEELSTLLHLVDELIHKISQWEDLIAKYKTKEAGKKDGIQRDAPSNEYFKRVSQFLAHRMKFVNHIDKRYELKEVDLINSRFIATDNTIIHFQVMGTGQRQLTYILNKINYDGKVILAMFDEVAMMSKLTAQPIVDKMKKLRDEGKLMLGLLVSPTEEEVRITQW